MCVTSNFMTLVLPQTSFSAHKVGIHLDHPFHTWFVAAVVPARTQAGPVITHLCLAFTSSSPTWPIPTLGLRVLLADTTCGSETHATRVTNNTWRTEGLVFQFMSSASMQSMQDSTRCLSFEVAKQRLDEMGPISDDEKVFLFVMLGSSTNPSQNKTLYTPNWRSCVKQSESGPQRIANDFAHSFSRWSWFGNRSKFLSLKKNLSKTQLDQSTRVVPLAALAHVWRLDTVCDHSNGTLPRLCQDSRPLLAPPHDLLSHLWLTWSHRTHWRGSMHCHDPPFFTPNTDTDPVQKEVGHRYDWYDCLLIKRLFYILV
jgi:hypothetical protein